MLKKVIITCLLAVLPLMAFGQGTRVVKGTVKDAAGEPLPGASVLVSGTTNGTATDIDGKFSLNVPAGKTLEISFIGYATKTVEVGARTVIDVVLEEDALLLEETVVVGYGTQRKVDLTGAVDQIGSDVFVGRVGHESC